MSLKKLTDKMCARFLSLKIIVKASEKELDEIKEICKEAGSCATQKHVVVVKEKFRNILSTEEVCKHFKVDEEYLKANGLMKTSSYKEVSINEKGAPA